MARKCAISGKKRQMGHRVSHANNKTKHAFDVNIQSKRIFCPELNRTIRINISTSMIRTIDKLGLSGALKRYGLTLKQITA